MPFDSCSIRRMSGSSACCAKRTTHKSFFLLASTPPAVPFLLEVPPCPLEPSPSAAWGSAMGGRFCHLTLVTPIQATPEPLPVRTRNGRDAEALLGRLAMPGLGSQLSSGLGKGWVGTTVDYSLIMLGTPERNLPRNLPAQLCYPLRLQGQSFRAGVWGSWLPFSFPAFPHPESETGGRSGCQ